MGVPEVAAIRAADAAQARIASRFAAQDNGDYLESFLPELHGRIDAGFRAGIDTSLYDFKPDGREPFTLLFLGSFRHLPNVEALDWFVRQRSAAGARRGASRAADRDRSRAAAAAFSAGSAKPSS